MTNVSKYDFQQILNRPPEDILKLMLQVAQAHRMDPASAYIVEFDAIPKDPPKIKLEDFKWLAANYAYPNLREEKLPDSELVRTRMLGWLPIIDILSFNGYVIAGSFVVLACSHRPGRFPTDIDFYPIYDPADISDKNNITAQDLVMQSYANFIQDMDDCFENHVPRASKDKLCMSVTRTEKCTTLRLSNADEDRFARSNDPEQNWSTCIEQYQIIHRAHRSAPGVVVGFDLLCCKAYAQGKEIYFTLDAALCLYFGINPIDWRRESPSHIHRILKYANYGFVPIFPGLEPFPKKDIRYEFANGVIRSTAYRNHPNKDSPEQIRHEVGAFTHWQLEERRELQKVKVRATVQDPETGLPLNELEFLDDNVDDADIDDMLDAGSDYGSNDLMAIYYSSLSQLVKGKSGAACVIATRPLDIISNFTSVPIHTLLYRLAGGPLSGFYFGDHGQRLRDICSEIKILAFSEGGSAWRSRAKPLTKEQLANLVKLHEEMQDIIDTRTAEIGALADPIVKRLAEVSFITVNPGSQYTATFNPIVRKHPRDYFGENYRDVEISIAMPLKRYLLWMRKQPFETGGEVNNYFFKLPFDVVKMIFRWIDRMWVRSFMINHAGDGSSSLGNDGSDEEEFESLVIRASCNGESY
jgi:hypothetical protein